MKSPLASRFRRRSRAARLLAASGVGLLPTLTLLSTMPSVRADVIKADNTTALNVAASYTPAGVPTATDRIIFDNTIVTAGNNNAALGGDLSIAGIVFGTTSTLTGNAYTINNTPGATLTLGSSGVALTSTNNNFNINVVTRLGASQTWDVATGRTLATGGSSVDLGANVLTVQGAGNTTIASLLYGAGGSITKAGTGTLTLNAGTGSANTANGGSLFSGGINVGTGGTVAISASNTAGTGAITSSGTLTISQSQYLLAGGITVNAGTTTLSGGISAGTGTLTLAGGALVISNTTAAQLASVVLNSGTFTPAASTTFGSLAGSVGFTAAAGTLTFGTNNTNATYSGNISAAGVASNIAKTGSGTQILNGTDSTTGTITANGSGGTLEIGGQFTANTGAVGVSAGTLRLNFNAALAPATNLLNPASTLTAAGGTLAIAGKDAATTSQTFASTSFTAGTASNLGVVNGAGASATALNLGGLTRNAGSAVNFTLPSGTQSATNGILASSGTAGALLVPTNGAAYATVGGADFAAKDATNAFIVPLASAVNATATSLGATTDNSNITGVDPTIAASTSINTIRFNDTAARTLTINTGQTLTVAASGILVSNSVTAPGSRITGGSITSATDVIIHQFSAQPFTLNSPVTGTGVILTKAGPGTLILTAGNSNSGLTYVASGRLQIGAGGNVGGNSILQLSPNDPTAVFDVNNQTTTVGNIGGGSATGGYVTLGSTGTLNDVSAFSATFSGALVGGVGSTFNKTGGNNGFQGANQAFYGTLNVTGTGSIGIFGGGGFINANVNVSTTGTAFSQGGSGATVALGNISGTGGTLVAGSNTGANGTYNFGYLGGNTSFAGIFANGTFAGTPGLTSIGKFGSGTTTLSGNNTYTGATQINSGGLIFDYSTGNTPLPTGSALSVGGGTATFRGLATGTTAITTGTFGVNNGVLSRVVVDGNGGGGTTLTLTATTPTGALVPSLASSNQNNVLLFDLSSSASNVLRTSVAIGAAAATDTAANAPIAIRTNNGLLATGNGNGTTLNNYRADVLIRDSTGIGFATNNASTIISRYTAATPLTAAADGATVLNDNTNYKISNTTLTRSIAFLYNTVELDSSTAPTALVAAFDAFTRFGNGSASSSGRGVLATGSNGATITSGGGTNQPTFFNNYQTGTTAGQTLTLNMDLQGVSIFNGTGLTVATRLAAASDQIFQSGVTRLTGAQTSGDALTAGGGVYRLVGGVLEIGADLTGTTSATSTADFSRSVGAAAGQVQLLGDTGFSAFGGSRTVNLGGSAQTLVWGNDNFLASPVGTTTEGNNTFRLSSAFSDSTIDFQNGIALGNITRNVDVANGTAGVDARLSGVISGVFAPTVTLANGNPAVLNAAAGLTKLGLGTLELTGANTYRGQTTISAGTLLVNNTTGSGTGSGGVVVNTGILGGIGTVNVGANTVAVNTGGTLAPGNSPGILTVVGTQTATPTTAGTGTLNLNTGSTLSIEISGLTAGNGAGNYDQVNLIGTLALGGGNLVLTLGGFTAAAGNVFTIVSNDGNDAVFGTFAQGASVTADNGQMFAINYAGGDGNDITLTFSAVPEPSTYALLALGLGGLGLAAARRRRQVA